MEKSITNVRFDLGGVVLRWNPDEILRNFYADESLRVLAKLELFQPAEWQALARCTLLDLQAIRRCHERSGGAADEMAALLRAATDSLRPIPETVAILDELATRGIPLYCLSNMPAATAEHLRAQYSFWKAFRGVVISGEIHLLKPEPAIFDYISRRFDMRPQDTAFIDDHLPNIESAAGLGFETGLFENPTHRRRVLRERFSLKACNMAAHEMDTDGGKDESSRNPDLFGAGCSHEVFPSVDGEPCGSRKLRIRCIRNGSFDQARR